MTNLTIETIKGFTNNEGARKSYFRIDGDRIAIDGHIFPAPKEDFYVLDGRQPRKMIYNDVLIEDNEQPDKLLSIYNNSGVVQYVRLTEDENRFRISVLKNSYTLMQRMDNGSVTWARCFEEEEYLAGKQFILCSSHDEEFVFYKDSKKALLKSGKNKAKVQMVNYNISNISNIFSYAPKWFLNRFWSYLLEYVDKEMFSAVASRKHRPNNNFMWSSPQLVKDDFKKETLSALMTWVYRPGLQYLDIYNTPRKDMLLTDAAMKRLSKASDAVAATQAVFPRLSSTQALMLHTNNLPNGYLNHPKEFSLLLYLAEDPEVISLLLKKSAQKERGIRVIDCAVAHSSVDTQGTAIEKKVSFFSIRKFVRKLKLQKEFDAFVLAELESEYGIYSRLNNSELNQRIVNVLNDCLKGNEEGLRYMLGEDNRPGNPSSHYWAYPQEKDAVAVSVATPRPFYDTPAPFEQNTGADFDEVLPAVLMDYVPTPTPVPADITPERMVALIAAMQRR